jgi:hypothetical protein
MSDGNGDVLLDRTFFTIFKGAKTLLNLHTMERIGLGDSG